MGPRLLDAMTQAHDVAAPAAETPRRPVDFTPFPSISAKNRQRTTAAPLVPLPPHHVAVKSPDRGAGWVEE